MGRRPPPAVLVRPEDILEAVRASILLGAVLPELRSRPRRWPPILPSSSGSRDAIVSDRRALGDGGRRAEGSRSASPPSWSPPGAARRGRAQRRVRARAGRRPRPPGRHSQRIDRADGDGNRRRPACAEQARKAEEAQGRETPRAVRPGGLPRSGAPGPENPLSEAEACSRAGQRRSRPGNSEPPTAMAERRAAFRSPPGRRRRGIAGRTAGWPLPGLSGPMADS